MTIYLGADHGGFGQKEGIRVYLEERGFQVEDCGAYELDPEDDYPVFALCVAEKVAEDPKNRRGILFCRNGIGVSIVANKVDGVRAAHAETEEIARTSREDDNTNVLTVAADYIDEMDVQRIVDTWLETEFSGQERHNRRIQMIAEIENTSSE